jgi:hypothetical protein
MCHARKERVLLFGARSADYIRASSHSGCIATEAILQAKQAEYMAAPERFAEMPDFPLAPRAPSIHVHTWHFASFAALQKSGTLLDQQRTTRTEILR